MGQEWFENASRILKELAAQHGKPGDSFSLCERFTGAPAEISPSGLAAWHFRVEGMHAEANRGETDDADLRITGDYGSTLPMARLVYTPDNAEQRKAHAAKFPTLIEGDVSKVPGYLSELHNRLAVITA
ncbi:hypothetical protein NSU_3405 [Novosphingobium pentaromativorans US6-1]|uniref:Uncharacterized protein n=2 Tax=Novosphingobium pentaromativorans TaxID=205844 RepID=G6EGD3_9SPHN|nr:hypothetical protein NSU_3405 [Novosphingobium pentaromativorans US6-1]